MPWYVASGGGHHMHATVVKGCDPFGCRHGQTLAEPAAQETLVSQKHAQAGYLATHVGFAKNLYGTLSLVTSPDCMPRGPPPSASTLFKSDGAQPLSQDTMTGLYALLPLGRGLRLKQLLKHPMGRLMLSGAALLAAVCCVVLLFEQDPSAFASHGTAAGSHHASFAGHRSTASFGGLGVGADATLNPNLYYYVASQQGLVEERTKYKVSFTTLQ